MRTHKQARLLQKLVEQKKRVIADKMQNEGIVRETEEREFQKNEEVVSAPRDAAAEQEGFITPIVRY